MLTDEMQTARLNLEKKIAETEQTAVEAEAFLDQLKRQPANPYGTVSGYFSKIFCATWFIFPNFCATLWVPRP